MHFKYSYYTFILFLLHLQQFLSCGPLLWILGQRQFDKVVEVVCPVAQKKGKWQQVRKPEQTTQKGGLKNKEQLGLFEGDAR